MSDIRDRKFCSLCKRPFSKKEIEAKVKLKGERVRAALKTARMLGEPVGRPRESDWNKIKELRDSGMIYREIAQTLGISCQSVYRALKK